MVLALGLILVELQQVVGSVDQVVLAGLDRVLQDGFIILDLARVGVVLISLEGLVWVLVFIIPRAVQEEIEVLVALVKVIIFVGVDKRRVLVLVIAPGVELAINVPRGAYGHLLVCELGKSGDPSMFNLVLPLVHL